MKYVSAMWILLVICGISTIKAQSSGTSIKPSFKVGSVSTSLTSDVAFNSPATKIATSSEGLSKSSAILEPSANNIENITPIQFKYAMMMDVNVETLTDASLYSFIDDWTGTRYRMGGSTKHGIDCSAFTSTLLMAVYSFAIPRTAREQFSATKRITKDDLTEGDLVFFNTTGGISHVGLYLSNGYFVHSCSSEGVTINNLDDPYYSHRFLGGGRFGK